MRGFAAVFGREVSEWWKSLAIASLALGVVAAVLPMGMAQSGLSVSDIRSGTALLLAVLLSIALAVILGGSIVSSDLAEKRLGFYFARPLQGWALWTGKLAAAVALAAGGGLLVLVPSLLLGDGPGLSGDLGAAAPMRMNGLVWAVVLGAGLLYVLLAAHAFSVILRSRSPWIGLDIAALGCIVALFGMARGRLILAGVGGASPVLVTDLGLFLLIGPILFAAGAVQVLEGRTDIRRGHRFLSGTLWGLLLALMLLFEASSRWIVHASPADLVAAYHVTAPGEGSWIAIAGPAKKRPNYMPAFLYDVSSGEFERARFGVTYEWGPALAVDFSADGRRAVWLEFLDRPFRSPLAVWYHDLDRPGARPVRTSVLFEGAPPPQSLAVSPDGARFAILHKQRILVTEIETGRLLASLPQPRDIPFSRLSFVGSDRLRLYVSTNVQGRNSVFSAIQIFEVDVPAATVAPTGHVPGVSVFRGWSLSPAGDRVILRGRKELRLLDARTGEALAELEGGARAFASFLRDGRILVVRSAPEGMELSLFAPDGRAELHRFRFPGSRRLAIADQPAGDRLRIVTASTLDKPRDWEIRLLDLGTGKVRSVAQRTLTSLDPQGYETPFDFKIGGGVVWFDWTTGQERAILKNL
ncbi:MAG TPA: hypothetical protein VG477_11390 [Thermoanaerobaculia bacterium]|nr:hypothetical protein [Thermoanaerobaculia bacterium]